MRRNGLSIAGVVLAAILLSGCVTKPIAYESARPVPSERMRHVAPASGETGTVRVTRDVGLSGGGCRMVVSIDGEEAARLDDGERAEFTLAAGEYIFALSPSERGLCGVQRDRITRRAEVIVRRGQLKSYRAGINPHAGPIFEPAE